MLYIFDEIDKLEESYFESKKSLLSEERYAKIQRLRSTQHKNASATAYLLLRYALSEIYNINEAVEFAYADKGKPLLKSYPHIHFNLSHSKDVAACAVSNNELGVDVQYITNVKDALAKRVLTDNEYVDFKKSLSPEEFFCEVWTIKESYLKKTGQGITTELRDISVDSISDIMIYRSESYFCCVNGPHMKVKHIRREDIEQL